MHSICTGNSPAQSHSATLRHTQEANVKTGQIWSGWNSINGLGMLPFWYDCFGQRNVRESVICTKRCHELRRAYHETGNPAWGTPLGEPRRRLSVSSKGISRHQMLVHTLPDAQEGYFPHVQHCASFMVKP